MTTYCDYDGIIKKKQAAPRYRHCPFCGAAAITLVTCSDLGECEHWEKCKRPASYAIVCDVNKGGCGAMAGYRKTPQKALYAWNTRDAKRHKTVPISREEISKRLKPEYDALKDLEAFWGKEE